LRRLITTHAQAGQLEDNKRALENTLTHESRRSSGLRRDNAVLQHDNDLLTGEVIAARELRNNKVQLGQARDVVLDPALVSKYCSSASSWRPRSSTTRPAPGRAPPRVELRTDSDDLAGAPVRVWFSCCSWALARRRPEERRRSSARLSSSARPT